MRTHTSTWFEATVRYRRQTEEGGTKTVSELYVVDAFSFAEAEARVKEELKSFADDGVEVRKLAIAPYTEVSFSDKDEDSIFYRSHLTYTLLNERTGKEGKTQVVVLVQASSIENARKNIVEMMGNSTFDYEIKSITERPIFDVFETNVNNNKQ